MSKIKKLLSNIWYWKWFILSGILVVLTILWALSFSYWLITNDWGNDIGNFLQDIDEARSN